MEPQSQDPNKTDLKTLTSMMESLQKEGFKENFMVNEEGLLYDVDTKKVYTPQQVRIPNFYRFEGSTDPADSSILYAIETDDGARGLLSDAYGPYSDPEVSKFIAEVQEINKKTVKGQKI
jgi:hypothetical protein